MPGPDRFRLEYRALSDDDREAVAAVKRGANALCDVIESLPGPVDARARALALTNLEQAVFWAVKAITA